MRTRTLVGGRTAYQAEAEGPEDLSGGTAPQGSRDRFNGGPQTQPRRRQIREGRSEAGQEDRGTPQGCLIL